jgi:hypothetical protein
MTVLPETSMTAAILNVRGENGVRKKLGNHVNNRNNEPNTMG